jgi:hypothetical protein
MCPQFIHRFNDFEKDGSYEDVANKTVKSAEQLQLEAEGDKSEELTGARGAELEAAGAEGQDSAG